MTDIDVDAPAKGVTHSAGRADVAWLDGRIDTLQAEMKGGFDTLGAKIDFLISDQAEAKAERREIRADIKDLNKWKVKVASLSAIVGAVAAVVLQRFPPAG